jgi:RNA polymerase sigma factor (sigma-70 family)
LQTAPTFGYISGVAESVAPESHSDRRDFCTTRWSVVLRAGNSTEEARTALERLCSAYWYPLYVFVRRRGHDADTAQDLTQGFFLRLIADESLRGVNPEKGRFRAFLLASMKNFIANDWRHSHRLKRGGGVEIVAWNAMDAEERFQLEPRDARDPECEFDRRWAQALVSTSLTRLGEEMARDGEGARFEALKGFLQGTGAGSSYAEAGQELGMTEAGAKTAVFRMRRRYSEIIREEIAETVSDPAQVEDEIRHLIAILAQ